MELLKHATSINEPEENIEEQSPLLSVKNEVLNEMKMTIEKLTDEKVQTEENALDLILKVKKDDMEILDKMRSENDELAEKLIRTQLLLEQSKETERIYKQHGNYSQHPRNDQCNMM